MNTTQSTRLTLTAVIVVCAALIAPATAATAAIDSTAANATTALQDDRFEMGSEGQSGGTVTVTLSTTASNVAGYQANVTFDPDIVRVTSVEGADFEDPVANVKNDSGWVFLTQSRTDGTNAPAFASITFEIVSAGTTGVAFVENDSSINDDAGERIAVSLDGTELKVTDGGDGDDGDEDDSSDGGDDDNGDDDDGNDGGDGDEDDGSEGDDESDAGNGDGGSSGGDESDDDDGSETGSGDSEDPAGTNDDGD